MKKLNNAIRALSIRAHAGLLSAKSKLKERNGQFVIDHAAVFIIIIVLAGIALGLLSTYIKTDFATELKSKISSLFNIS